jgi:hypothetical protein
MQAALDVDQHRIHQGCTLQAKRGTPCWTNRAEQNPIINTAIAATQRRRDVAGMVLPLAAS